MTAIKTFTIAIAIIATASVAAAQNLNVPIGLDLNGIWELGERGERLDAATPLVLIEHTGNTVTAKFLTGAECFDGTKRTVVFVGTLSFAVPGGNATLASNNMPVCSGSSSVVKKCKGSIESMYQSRFTGVTIAPDLNTGKPNLITGQRYAQGYDGCKRDSSSDGTHSFTLERTSPCAVEERKLNDRAKEVRDLMGSILGAREVFRQQVELAQGRYGPTFNGTPTDNLKYPAEVLDESLAFEQSNGMNFFEDHLPAALASPRWRLARIMAETLNLVGMLEQMGRIEFRAPEGQRAAAAVRRAEAEFDACLARHQ